MSRVVAVTGASGFVGRHLVRRLLAEGWQVRALGRRPVDGARFERWEAGRTEPSALAGVDAVCHLAAHLPASYADPDEASRCLEVNALGTLELLRAAREAGVPAFVYVSSGNVYAPTVDPVRETDPIWPASAAPWYLSSKAVGDLYVAHAGQAGWMRTVQLRPSAVYGPGMTGGVVATFAARLARGEPVRVSDGGRHRVDPVLVDDVVEAVLRAVERPVRGPYNIGSGRSTSVLEIARWLAAAIGAREALVELEPPSDRPATGFAPLAIDRARDDLGYVPTPPAEGLARYAASVREAR